MQEAWISGVSTRKVDDPVQAMGIAGMSRSTVSRLCKDIDERVHGFLNRPLTGEWPYLWLDATCLRARQGGRIVPVAAIIAVAANTDGRGEIIGPGVGPSEAEPFRVDFLRRLHARGLTGNKWVISDAHGGLRNAIKRVRDATWQCCRVHWMRNALAHVSRGRHTVVAAATRQALYGYSMNFIGLPAGNIAANYSDGLPVGVQIVGRRFREDLILDACEAVEQRVGVMAERLFERG